MHKFSAAYIITLNSPPLKNGIVITSDDGEILDVIDTGGHFDETAGIEYLQGVICPGFVNAHCHLELSHLKGKIKENAGLPGFVKQINLLRNVDREEQERFCKRADTFLLKTGTIAVGDISNTAISLSTKQQSKLHYHTFIESFGFSPSRAETAFAYAEFLSEEFTFAKLENSIVPHSPYSVSIDLFQKIYSRALAEKSIISIHHQESEHENQLFRHKNGELLDHLEKNLNIDTSFWNAPGTSSTDAILPMIPVQNRLLLVHNCYVTEHELNSIRKYRDVENTFWVVCPRSNQFIGNLMPNFELLITSGYPICIGTDSLASNWSLSMIEELKTIQSELPMYSAESLLKWACLNGAKALDIDRWAGTIEKGKRPGLNLISDFDSKNFRFTKNSSVRKLL